MTTQRLGQIVNWFVLFLLFNPNKYMSMKKELKYIILLPLMALVACGNEEELRSDILQRQDDILQISVTASDFSIYGTNDTRAIDNGKETIFEDGDRVGVIVLDGSQNILANNIPYKYDISNGTWSFDSSNDEEKKQCYYDKRAVSYIVYFPYSSKADDTKNVEGLKNKFPPQVDQKNKDGYRASDLMIWSSFSNIIPLSKLNVTLTHAYASVSILLKVKCMLTYGGEISYVSTRVSDVNLTISNKSCYPYQAEDGSFRYILPTNQSFEKIRYFFTLNDNTYSNTLDISNTISNYRYVTSEMIQDLGTYSLDRAQIGDFYCKKDNDEGYLIPGDIYSFQSASIPDVHDVAFIGIVSYVGHNELDASNYIESGIGKEKCNGYIMALTDVNEGSQDRLEWECKRSDGSNRYDQYVGASTLVYSCWNGYAFTKVIEKYVSDSDGSWHITDFPAANGCILYGTENCLYNWQKRFAATKNSSGWFLPSDGQLEYLFTNPSNLSTRFSLLSKAFSDSNIKWFDSNSYWSSRDWNYTTAHAVRSSIHWSYKNSRYNVRAVCAF